MGFASLNPSYDPEHARGPRRRKRRRVIQWSSRSAGNGRSTAMQPGRWHHARSLSLVLARMRPARRSSLGASPESIVIPRSADPVGGCIPARRGDGHSDPPDHARVGRGPRPVHRHREQAGGGRLHRLESRRGRRGGRLYTPDGGKRDRDKPSPAQEIYLILRSGDAIRRGFWPPPTM